MIPDLLEELHISSVYWVDDDNTDWQDLSADLLLDRFPIAWADATPGRRQEAIKALTKNLNAGGVVKQLRSLKQEDNEDDNLFIERVDVVIRSAAANEDCLIERLRTIGTLLPQPFSTNEKRRMCAIFSSANTPSRVWRQWSFTDWHRESTKQLLRHSPDAPGLFIIDLQNRDKTTTIDGRAILDELAKSGLARDALHVLVLTSECDQQGEFKLGRSLTVKHFSTAAPLQLPVFVMAKERLASDDIAIDPMRVSISEALSRISLSSQHRRLKTLLAGVFRDAIDSTFQDLERLTIEEFMYAVTQRSETEGVPEIDTLLRIVGIEQRRKLQEAIVENDEVHQVLTRIRGTGLCLDRSQLASDSNIQELRTAELYDSAEVVNRLRSPICPGDLFQVDSNQHGLHPMLYCLVGNFCDLSLRGDGSRKAKIGLFLPVVHLGGSKGGDRLRYTLEKLRAVIPGDADGVLLNSFKSVDFSILDLCWTNDNGMCCWNLAHPLGTRRKLNASQEARYQVLDRFFKSTEDKSSLLAVRGTLGSKVEYCARTTRPSRKRGNRPARFTSSPQSIPLALRFVDFGISRVGRLTHAHASHLVAEFADALGRASRLHDFSGAA